MKISKLFHWLYAILMLLPVFFIGVRCAYTVFNKNAKDSYSGTLETEIVNNIVHDKSSLSTSQSYYFVSVAPNTTRGNIGASNNCIVINNVEIIENNTGYDLSNIVKIGAYQNPNANYLTYYFWYNDTNTFNFRSDSNYFVKLKFNYIANNLTEYSFLTETSSIYFETFYNYAPLDNAFEYSVNQLNEVPLFSWAKDSFLVQPFSYITGLFGLESTSPINTMLSYWLSISIIWLVFDLVMYVPLLVHRWLDKGVLD